MPVYRVTSEPEPKTQRRTPPLDQEDSTNHIAKMIAEGVSAIGKIAVILAIAYLLLRCAG